MQNPGYVALSRQIVLERQLAVTANNIANLNTAGFKRQGMLFQEHLAEAGDGASASYVTESGSMRDLRQGALRTTERQLDLAINGDAYFNIETPGGLRYGRDGQFQLRADGTVVTRNDYPLLTADGLPIVVPQGASQIVVQKNGALLADGAEIGRIALTRFNNPQALIHTADGLYRSDDGVGEPSADAVVRQGMLESSNVNPIVELTHMLDIQRAYESAHKMTKGEHDRLTRAIREIGSIDQS